MNIHNLRRLRDHIESQPEDKINMAQWLYQRSTCFQRSVVDEAITNAASDGNWCGTAGCILGHIIMLTNNPNKLRDKFPHKPVTLFDLEEIAYKFLDASPDDCDRLFTGEWTDIPLHNITKQQVLDRLDQLIKIEETIDA